MDATASQMASVVVWGGFVLSFIFGAVASKANFCTMGAVSDIVNMGHWGRMRMWLLAIAVAIAGATALAYTGQVDLSKAIAQRPTLTWLSLLAGGLTFGVGMTLGGGCANKNLIRLGGGSVRSLVVLAFMGIASYMTLKGLFGQWRATWLDPVAINLGQFGWKDQSLATAVSRATGMAPRIRPARHGGRAGAGAARLRLQGQALSQQSNADSRVPSSSARWLSPHGSSAATWASARTRRRWSSATSPPTRAPSSR